MGHGDHHAEVKVPDYRIYKVEDCPLLVTTQRALAAQGLKDPWLRNEVWRFNAQQFGTEGSRAKVLVFRGFRLGFGAFVLTMIGTAIYNRIYPEDHGHGDHH